MASEIRANLISPATASTVTLGSSGQTIALGSGATASGFGGGKVLNTVQTTKTDTTNTSSASFVDISGMTVDIVPTATTSKMLVAFNISVGDRSGWRTYVNLVRDSTEIFIGDADASRIRCTFHGYSSSNEGMETYTMSFLDPNTPADTSTAITYKLQWKHEGATYPTYLNRTYNNDATKGGMAVSSIIVQEIGA